MEARAHAEVSPQGRGVACSPDNRALGSDSGGAASKMGQTRNWRAVSSMAPVAIRRDSIRRLQPLEHGEVLHVQRGKLNPVVLGSCGDEGVSEFDSMTAP